MALGYRGSGVLTESAVAAITVAAPAGQLNTDLSFLIVGLKGCTMSVAPSGWVVLTQSSNGSVVSGIDTGSVTTIVYTRQGVTGSASFTVTTAAGSVTISRMLTYTRAATELFQYSNSVGYDATNGANYSGASTDVLDGLPADLFMAFTTLNSDAGARTSPTLTSTGLIFGSVTTRLNDQSSVGNDCGLMVVEEAVTSGTASVGPIFGFTNASSSSGSTVFVRLRAVTAVIEVLPLDDFSIIAGYQVTASALSGYSEYQIQRVDLTGGTAIDIVRGGARKSLSGVTTVVLDDYEFRFRNEDGIVIQARWDLLLYLNNTLQGTLSSATRTPVTDAENDACYDQGTSPFSWVKNVITPALNQAVSVGDFDTYARSGRILGKLNVLGRSKPVVITDLLAGSEGTFTVLVDRDSSWTGANSVVKYNSDLRLLFNTGSVYLFQTMDPFSTAIMDFYFSIESIQVKRETRVVGVDRSPTTTWSIKYIEVDRPSASDVALSTRTWNDVALSATSWNGVLATNDTWLSVYLGA